MKRNVLATVIGFALGLILLLAMVFVKACGEAEPSTPQPQPCVHSYSEGCDEFGEYKGGPLSTPHPDSFFENEVTTD